MNLSANSITLLENLVRELTANSDALKTGAVNGAAGTASVGALQVNDIKEYVFKRTYTWVAPVGNTDYTVISLPAKFELVELFIVVDVLPVAGAGLTSTQLQMGTAAGGVQLIAAKNYLTAGLPAAGSTVGIVTAELGASLPSANNFRAYFPTAQDLFLRVVNAGGAVGTTAGQFTVHGTIVDRS